MKFKKAALALCLLMFGTASLLLSCGNSQVNYDFSSYDEFGKLEHYTLQDDEAFAEFVAAPSLEYLKKNSEWKDELSLRADINMVAVDCYHNDKWIKEEFVVPDKEYQSGPFFFDYNELSALMTESGLEDFLEAHHVKSGQIYAVKMISFSKYGLPILFWVKTEKNSFYIVKDYNERYMDNFEGERMIYTTYTNQKVMKAF